MGCAVCGKHARLRKAMSNKFGKQDIQALIKQLKEQRSREINKKTP